MRMNQTGSDERRDGGTLSVRIHPHVAWEAFDGEVIIVNLNIGLYHALNESAGFIWSKIADGTAFEAIFEEVAREYDVSEDVARSMVEVVIAEIESVELADVIRPTPDRVALPVTKEQPTTASFVWPAIETYRDMRQALVLDPIHEVDESGWPNPKPELLTDRNS